MQSLALHRIALYYAIVFKNGKMAKRQRTTKAKQHNPTNIAAIVGFGEGVPPPHFPFSLSLFPFGYSFCASLLCRFVSFRKKCNFIKTRLNARVCSVTTNYVYVCACVVCTLVAAICAVRWQAIQCTTPKCKWNVFSEKKKKCTLLLRCISDEPVEKCLEFIRNLWHFNCIRCWICRAARALELDDDKGLDCGIL